ncbi:MAG: endolytic transglycosylase MltG [Patescibacteria group bacterium]
MKKVIIVVIVILLVVGFIHFRTMNSVSENSIDKQFTVEKGDDIIIIGKNLEKEGLVKSRVYFYYYAWKKKLRGSITAGEYMLTPNSNIAEIVQKMTSGDAIMQKRKDIKVTFPEGWTVKKMSERLNKNELPGDEFTLIAQNPPEELYVEYSFLKRDASLEGYLFPDTYFFVKEATALDVVKKMLDNFDKKIDENYRKTIEESNRELHDVIIFASVIEGEVSSSADRYVIAGIFKNRLDIGMALESDATLDYIKGIPEIKHSKADTEIDSLYNTYKYPGLPVGPINNPSLESINAAMAPKETDYMYFLNDAETGETVFSKTFEEHISNKGKHGL